MHHMYPLAKGDQLCPLGFHPQVRWPTRCKRCFRDYKEHGGKRVSEEIAASSPVLFETLNSRQSNDSKTFGKQMGRTWTSTQNLLSGYETNGNNVAVKCNLELRKRPSSWTSTPDLDASQQIFNNNEENDTNISVSVKLPSRRRTTSFEKTEEFSNFKEPTVNSSSISGKDDTSDLKILKTDNLAERVRKVNLLKKQNSTERENGREKSVTPKLENEFSELEVQQKGNLNLDVQSKEASPKRLIRSRKRNEALRNQQDVEFLMQVKQKSLKVNNENGSMTTETTDTTLVGDPGGKHNQDEISSLQEQLEKMKARAERAERDKSDILLRRLASLDTLSNRTAASEALKLQQKVNELKTELEELREDKKTLSNKVRKLEQDANIKPSKSIEDELRRKLQAAEQLCEELMDENEDVKKELHGMEQEIDEMHDNFREDQVEEFTSLRKELEQTTKNCRILSFKLKKSERKIEQFETERHTLNAQNSQILIEKIKKLEEELKLSNEINNRLQVEAEQSKNPTKRKTPTLGVIGKSTSADGKISRESLTRGGSQEDPAQLMRDLQDSMEREADLKEQLKFAEEEAESLRKKSSRVEDENESLMMQLKKMAVRARTGRKLSPTPSRLTPEPPVDHDEGISDEDDPAELRVLLELNEQEASVLRQKVEELETENNKNKKQISELQEKLKTNFKIDHNSKKLPSFLPKAMNSVDKKIKILEDETNELRKSLIEKDRKIELLNAEIINFKTKTVKNSFKANSFDSNEQPKINVKRQLELVEQEATILRGKVSNLEEENDKLSLENKKLQVQSLRKNSIPNLEKNGSINNLTDLSKVKEQLTKTEKERDELNIKLKNLTQEVNEKLPPRIPKKFTDLTTKTALKKMIDELEKEVTDMRIMILNCGANKLQKTEAEKLELENELRSIRNQLKTASSDIESREKDSLTEMQLKLNISEEQSKALGCRIQELEDKIKKQDSSIKKIQSAKLFLETQLKQEKLKITTLESNLDKEKLERMKWESKVTELDDEINVARKNSEKMRKAMETEILDIKSKVGPRSELSLQKKYEELKIKNEELQCTLTTEVNKYLDVETKFETLKEEHILSKAQLTTEKGNLQSKLNATQERLNVLEKKVTDNSDLEKKLQEARKRIKDLESKSIKSGSIEYEKNMLRTTLKEKERDLEKLKKENDMNIDLFSQIKRENDDLKKKLDDFERVSKVHRTLNDHNAKLEMEIKKLRVKLENCELAARSEIASTRLRYEQQLSNIQAEFSFMQRQCEKFKKDRDSFKQLLGSAQKTISELKHNSGRQSRTSMNSGDEDDKNKIVHLEQQIGCLEDQLCESRLEVSKFKTELVSERSANEIKISEMTSKLNELEEERLLSSGRTKIAGMKTKLELAWQKEREEQQKLIQEVSTLARDLRQTLFDVERERDKGRLESKRKIEQLKKANEEELEEGRRKISELQCDLLELRDAHARLRTANEKLRRERERYERETNRKRKEIDCERKMVALLNTVDEIIKIAPQLNRQLNLSTEVQKHNHTLSTDNNNIQIKSILARLAETSEELRRYQRQTEDDKERDKVRRIGMRRAASIENDVQTIQRVPASGRLIRGSGTNSSLIRKCLSLDQSMQQDQSFWNQEGDSMSSMQSIGSDVGVLRGSNMDSRLSGGSTQSDMPRMVRKKKRGLMGKLRSFTKSRGAESEGSMQGSDSDVSLTSDLRSNKKDLKGRLSGMFKRSGSASRSASAERSNNNLQQKPVAVTIVGNEERPKPLPKNPKPIKPVTKSSASTTPLLQRKTK